MNVLGNYVEIAQALQSFLPADRKGSKLCTSDLNVRK